MILVLLQLTIAATVPVTATDSLQAAWETSLPFPTFLEATRTHTDAWYRGYQGAVVPDSLMERARRVVRRWRILVVTDFGCHDSLNSIPVLARLADGVTRIEVRVADTRTGARPVGVHRT